MFKEYVTVPIRLRSGMECPGRALQYYVIDKQYSPAIKGEEFGEMVMDVFSQINTGISLPIQGAMGAPTCYPLSMCLKDRAFEYIVANEEENPPAHVNLRQDQCYQWFPDLQQSKVCQRVRGRDVPAPVIRLIAIEKAVIRLKRQDAQTLAGSASADVTLTQQFMGGSPATPVRPGRPPVVQMQGGGMSTPQSMAYHRPDTPGTLHQDDVEAEVRMLGRQREWVRNPEYINEQDMKAMRRLGVNVIKMMVPTAHKHLVSKMKPLNFNSELKKLVVSTRTPLEKATKLRREITGEI